MTRKRRDDTRSKSNYLRRRRVARPKEAERREVPNGPVRTPRRRV
ncbi:MAG TPA: hypothetical protein VNP36_05360 [Burkholderiales bacterium]|nr:hypothetical protein [Burkholderiales bacterium]